MAASLLAAGLAACGGGGSMLRPPNAGTASQSKGAIAAFHVLVPGGGGSSVLSNRRKPAFVSPAIASVSITVSTNAQPTTANISATSPGCTSSANGISCTVNVTALAGSDTFTISAYDQPNEAGKLLSVGTVIATILPGTNTVNVAMSGVVANLALGLSQPLLPNGSAATSTLVVEAIDPDGNVIVGPGNYLDANGNALTIAVSSSDGSGNTKLNGSTSASVTAPSNAALTVSSTGALANGTTVLFTASATGVPSATVLLGIGPPGETIYVAEGGYSQVYAFFPGSTGNVAPFRVIQSTLTFPELLAYDSAGNVYVTDDNGNAGNIYEERINVYTPSASGNAEPLRQIGGPATGLNGVYGIAVDSNNYVWVGNYASGSTLSKYRRTPQSMRHSQTHRSPQGAVKPPFIAAFAPGANGNVAPVALIQGTNTGLTTVDAMAFDNSGNLWVTVGSTLEEFNTAQLANALSGGIGSPLNQAPAATATLPANPVQMTFDSGGNLYVAYCNPTYGVSVYAPPFTGTLTAARTLTDMHCPDGVALDGAGNLYATGYTATSTVIETYVAGISGSATPLRSITLPLPDQENCPQGLGVNAGRLDVLDFCAMALYSYPSSASGNAIPSRIIQAPIVYPSGLWEDASGNLYVANWGGAAGGVAVFAPGANGYAQPVRVIYEAGAVDNSYNPYHVAGDASGKIYAINDVYNTSIQMPNVAVFASGANGVTTPIATLAGTNTTLQPTGNFTLGKPQIDPSGNLVLLDSSTSTVDFFAPGANGNVAPIHTIAGASTQLGSEYSICLDAAGNVYVAEYVGGTTQIVVFAAGQYGNIAPTRTIVTTPAIVYPQDVWVDGTGAIYVAESGGSVAIYPPGANGVVAPTLLTGISTLMYDASGVAVGL